jgi:hypothetical protein
VTDRVHARTVTLLLRTYPASNVFWLSRLSARSERDVANALADLETSGLVICDNNRWSLTAAGLESCRPPQSLRPGSAVRYRPGPQRKQVTRP